MARLQKAFHNRSVWRRTVRGTVKIKSIFQPPEFCNVFLKKCKTLLPEVMENVSQFYIVQSSGCKNKFSPFSNELKQLFPVLCFGSFREIFALELKHFFHPQMFDSSAFS